MNKDWWRRFIPTQTELKEHKLLSLLGSLLHRSGLWRFNRHTIPKAVGVGVFCAFMPMPFQTFLATVLAIQLQANLPFSVGLVWISNPITMPPMFYGAYVVGKKILNEPNLPITGMDQASLAFILRHMDLIWKPFLLGTTICGLIFGIFAYFITKICWNLSVINKIKKRKRPSL